MVSFALLVLVVLGVTGVLYGGMLVAVGRDALPAAERVPRQWRTRWDLWHDLRRGARELARVRSLALRR